MLGRVVVENGVKKIVPLTADCGSGNPVGTVIAVYSNKVPNGYLPCNGVQFDTAQFPVLYALLQDDHTPDLRECTLKGIGESGRTVGAHVKAGGLAIGEFVDDRVQEHKHDYVVGEIGVSGTPAYYTGSNTVVNFHNAHSTNNNGRSGATTEVKAVGVNWCIKATSGINENQADNVLNILQPVDVVAVDNVHSVSSDAVYKAINTVTTQTVGWKKAHYGSVIFAKVGKVVFFSASSDWYELPSGYSYDLFDVPYGFRPIAEIKINEATRAVNVPLMISEGGSSAYCYNYSGAFSYARNGQYFGCWITNQ